MKIKYLNILALFGIFAVFAVPSIAKVQCTSCFWLVKDKYGCPSVDAKGYGCEKKTPHEGSIVTIGVEWTDGDCSSVGGVNLTPEDEASVGTSSFENQRCKYCTGTSCE